MKSEPINIIITSAGRRVELINIFKKELKNKFKHGKIIACDQFPDLSPACQIADEYFKSPSIKNKNYIKFLYNLCIKKKVGILIPTIDTDLKVLSKNHNKFLSINTKVICSNYDIIKICSDKRLISKFFIKKNLKTPVIYDYKKLKFPCFAKPYDGSSSKGIEKILNIDQSRLIRKKNKKTIFMYYLSHKNYSEYTIDAYYDKNNQLKCAVPRKRIETRGGEISKGIIKYDHIYRNFIKNFSQFSGVIGPINVQVMTDKKNKHIYYMEINPRLGGGAPISYYAGANFAKWLVQEYLLNKKIGFYAKWKKNIIALRYDQSMLITK